MATNYDILFLKRIVREGLAARTDALRCLEAIEAEAQRGRPINAAQAVVALGIVARRRALEVHDAVALELSGAGALVSDVEGDEAVREVSGEGPAVPPPPPPGYYDLAQDGEGLEDFFLGPLIGHGTVGSSYVGRRKSDGGSVVVKTLSSRFTEFPALLAEVHEELESWLGLRAPGLASLLALGRSHGHTVAVYERAPGQPLDAYLAEHGPLSSAAALSVVSDVTEALLAAHERGLGHGDLRSRKVHYDGARATLTDPGLARAGCVAGGFARYVPFGHPGYLAPEVLQEGQRRPTTTSDLYSLGILFYETLCGVPPFEGEVTEVLQQHLEETLPPPPDGVTFSTAMAGVILRLTAKTADMRIADAGLLLDALARLQDGKPFRLLSLASAQGPVESVTRDEWDDAQGQAVPQWTETRIEKAPQVGPAELATALPAHGPPSARLPAELVARHLAAGARLDLPVSGARRAPDIGEADSESDVARGDGAAGPGPRSAAPAAPPQVQVGKKLGRGPMGALYEGTATSQLRPVAVKVLSRKYAQHPELRERVLASLRAATALRHPNVVPILEVLHVSERDVVVSELVRGRTLRALLDEQGALAPRRAAALVIDLAHALEAAHQRGVFHGDVRPEKVLVDESGGIARLTDFGQAMASCLGAGFGSAGVSFGHPGYLAPEVVQEGRREPSAATDIYALGVLYYELLCGVAPFSGADAKGILRAHLKQRLPPPPEHVSVPPQTAQTILRMTAKDPGRRFASMAELREALRESLEVSTTSGEGPSPLAVEEFDPLASAEEVSPEMWGLQSQVVAKAPAEWRRDKIKDRRDDAARWTDAPTAQRTTHHHLGALYAKVRSASGEDQAPPPRATGIDLRQPQVAATAGGLLAVALLLLALVARALFGGGKPPRPEAPDARPDGTSTVVVTPPPSGPSPDEAERAVAAAISRYETGVRDHLAAGRFHEALQEAEAIDADVRGAPPVQEAVRALQAEVFKASADRLREVTAQVDDLLRLGEFERATQRVAEVGRWAVDAEAVAALGRRVELRREAETRLVRSLQASHPIDVADAQRALAGSVRGWSRGGTLFPGGGLILRYRRSDPALADDLQAISGPAPEFGPAPVGGTRGVRIRAGRDVPAVVALPIPFEAVVKVQVDVVLGDSPSPEGALGVLAGVDPARPSGVGVNWGLVPIERGPSGLSPLMPLAVPDLPPRRPLGIGFEVRTERSNRARLEGFVLDPASRSRETTPRAVTISRLDLGGRLGLVVLDAEVWITGLEVHGLLDGAALGRPR